MSLLSRILEAIGQPANGSRAQLQAVLTAVPSAQIPADAWPLLQELWSEESRSLTITRISELPHFELSGAPGSKLSLWQGDITKLDAGAIVNAANSGLTGCYQPFHSCVDNVIHTAAGPWLRQACEVIMQQRGRPEPTATATATRAFFLPSEYVIHTVGPIVPDGRPTAVQVEQLALCYREAIRLAVSLPVKSIAFCAISTGVFGYPKMPAAEVSLSAIAETLRSLDDLAPHVILTAYTDADEDTYRQALQIRETEGGAI